MSPVATATPPLPRAAGPCPAVTAPPASPRPRRRRPWLLTRLVAVAAIALGGAVANVTLQAQPALAKDCSDENNDVLEEHYGVQDAERQSKAGFELIQHLHEDTVELEDGSTRFVIDALRDPQYANDANLAAKLAAYAGVAASYGINVQDFVSGTIIGPSEFGTFGPGSSYVFPDSNTCGWCRNGVPDGHIGTNIGNASGGMVGHEGGIDTSSATGQVKNFYYQQDSDGSYTRYPDGTASTEWGINYGTVPSNSPLNQQGTSTTAPSSGSQSSVSVGGNSPMPTLDTAGAVGTSEVTLDALATLSWTVTTTVPWLHVSPASGTGSRTLTVTVDEYPETGSYQDARQGFIMVQFSNPTYLDSIAIIQEAPPLRINIGMYGSSGYFKGYSWNSTWSASVDVDWVAMTPTAGSGQGAYTVNWTASKNDTGQTRTATMRFREGVPLFEGLGDPVVVLVQPSMPVDDSSNPGVIVPTVFDWPVTWTGGTGSVTVTPPKPTDTWTARTDVDWLTLSGTAGVGTAQPSITAAQNWTGATRTGAATITRNGQDAVIVKVVQTPRDVSTWTWEISEWGGYSPSTLSLAGEWTVETDADWITATPTNGNTGGSVGVSTAIRIDFAPNEGAPRQAQVTFLANGLPAYVAQVNQAGQNLPQASIGSVTIADTATLGQTLTAAVTDVVPSNAVMSYQWLRSGEAIAGATGQSYVVQADDLGKSIRVRVTATKQYQYIAATVTSLWVVPQAAQAVQIGAVAIAGTPKVEEVLSAQVSGLEPADATLAYQWHRAGSPIDGATGQAYTVQAADIGQALTLSVTATAAGYTPATVMSPAVTGQAAGPITVGSVSLSGASLGAVNGSAVLAGAVGDTLTVAVAGVSPASASVAYAWYRGTSVITGVTGAQYKLTAADSGRDLVVKVTVSKAGLTSVVKYSPHVQVLGLTGLTVTGNAAPGQTLTAQATFLPADAAVTYQWYRGTAAIAGAKAATYKLVAADSGQDISLKATVAKGGAVSSAKYSNHVLVLGASKAVLSGSPLVGSVLTLEVAYAPADAQVTYTWFRGTSVIPQATGTSYVLTPADAAKDLVVKVTVSQPGLDPVVKYSNHFLTAPLIVE
jgi:hypothetical protein